MSSWDSNSLARLRQVAMDLTSLSATIEVLRARLPEDEGVERAAAFVDSLILHVSALVDRLREH